MLAGEAAKVPQVPIDTITHQVTVPVPVNVLAPATQVESDIIPAMVVEVSKDHAHEAEMPVVIQTQDVHPDPVNPTTVIKATSPVTINPCDLLCTKFEFDPVCATNGLCLHEFPNQCILDTYNCKHSSMKFSATKDDRCQMHWLTKCDESEMI